MNALLFVSSMILRLGTNQPQDVAQVIEPQTIPPKKTEFDFENESCSLDCKTCPENGMQDSVKKYDRHVVICDMKHHWPKRLEDIQGFPFNLIHTLEESKTNEIKVMITGCRHITECDENKVEVIVYPENLVFTLQEHEFESFAKLIYSKESLLASALPQFNIKKSWCEKLVLVCCHQERDKRCGKIGPQVIQELRRLLTEQNISEQSIAVRQTSHIGGHVFAGTLISYPSGVWYGKVTKNAVFGLLECIKDDKILMKCYRGKAHGKTIEW